MKLLLAILLLTLPHLAFAKQQCLNIFAQQATYALTDLSRTTLALRTVETDRYRFLNKNQTVLEYLTWLQKNQEAQLSAVEQIPFTALRPYFAENYHSMLRATLSLNRKNFRQAAIEYDLIKIKLSQLINPTVELQHLKEVVMQMTFSTNVILAELAAITRFPDVQLAETPIRDVISLTGKITPEMKPFIETVGNKTLDFVSRENDIMIWGEVKYLGRHKVYDKIAGDHIIEKMIDIKKLANMMSEKTRVALVLVGPGRLEYWALEIYLRNGIEVIYLTPHWH